MNFGAGSDGPQRLVLTVGHSTRSLVEFIALLQAHGVTGVVDVRTVPKSRHNPQFNHETLPVELQAAGMGYTRAEALGGFRRARPDSPNAGWRNLSFRGFADYMQTAEFAAGLGALIEISTRDRLALMCAEAVPWRCHRSLIADALVVRGFQVEEIIAGARTQCHKLTPFAVVSGTVITYPLPSPSPV